MHQNCSCSTKGFSEYRWRLASHYYFHGEPYFEGSKYFLFNSALLDCISGQNHSVLSETIKEELSVMLNSEDLLIDGIKKHIDESEMSDVMLNIVKKIGSPLEKLKKVKFISNLAE